MVFKNFILCVTIFFIAFADKRTDFIPKNKLPNIEVLKNVSTTTKVKPKKSEVKVFSQDSSTAKTLDTTKKIVKEKNKNKKNVKLVNKKEKQVLKNNVDTTLNVENKDSIVDEVSDTNLAIVQPNENIKTQTENSDIIRPEIAVQKPVKKIVPKESKQNDKNLFSSNKIFNFGLVVIFIVFAFVLGILISNYFNSKKQVQFANNGSTFSVKIGDDENESLISYSPPQQFVQKEKKDIFETIVQREDDFSTVEEDDFPLANEPISHDTIGLAKQFHRSQSEVELTMKMASNNVNQLSRYSEQVLKIENSEEENLKKKKDVSVVAKKLGIGKGEVLLSRHLQDLENKKMKG